MEAAPPILPAQVWVTLTKQEHIQLVWDAKYWKSTYLRVRSRLQQTQADHQSAMAQAAEREAALRNELEIAQAKIRDLQKRVFGRKSEQNSPRDSVPGSKRQIDAVTGAATERAGSWSYHASPLASAH